VATVVDDQHESETGPDVDEALSDAAGDMAKTPAEEDPTTAPEGPGTTGGADGDAAFDDAASDTVKSPGAGGDAA
jgi:hypothetical protein